MNITTIRNEGKRGCGYRKAGGMYLMAGRPQASCGKLPRELEVCPCCGAGFKPARGWTWVNAQTLFKDLPCPLSKHDDLGSRPVCQCILDEVNLPERMGLLWVGEKYYATPADFLKEGMAQGVSRRINAIPREFELGKTWVLFAHRKGIERVCDECSGSGKMLAGELGKEEVDCDACAGEGKLYTAAIFGCFLPERIEYVVKPDDPVEKLEQMEMRGITLVKLEWDKDARGNGRLFAEGEPEEDE